MTIRKSSSSFAVVTTIADHTTNAELFVRYHLAIGAEKIFVFIDDNNPTSSEILGNIPNVKVFLNNDWLRENWKFISVRNDAIFKKDTEKEVMYRQCLNLGVAAAYARYYGIDWLIHIDGDELLHLNKIDLGQFFRSLEQSEHGSCRFLNYEAIPTRREDLHYFEACQKFKINNFKLYGYEECNFSYTPAQIDLFRNTPWIQSKYYNFYANGKGATYLGEEFEILGVHCTIPKNGKIYRGKKSDALILHYACATFVQYKEKYLRLGDFIEYWFSDKMHLESKRIFSSKNSQNARDFYDTFMALDDEKISFLEAHSLVITIDAPAKLIKNLKFATLESPKIQFSHVEKNRSNPSEKCLPKSISLDFVVIAKECDALLYFSSVELARRWARRVMQKDPSIQFEVIPGGNGRTSLLMNAKPVADFSAQGNIPKIVEHVVALADDSSSIVIASTEIIFSENYETLSHNQIEADRFARLGQLAREIKLRCPRINVSFSLKKLSPLMIPLLSEGEVDYIYVPQAEIKFRHSKILSTE